MKHISNKNFNITNREVFLKEFSSNTPFPHLIIENFLNKESADKVLNNFEITNKWTNLSLVNN